MAPSANSPAVITLTTDFGLADGYVAAMKGVILERLPAARIVDISHEVPPQAMLEAAFILQTTAPYFPDGSVHVVIVDPGVGTSRRRLAIAAGSHVFIGPDNGCLSASLPSGLRGGRSVSDDYEARLVTLGGDVLAVSIENETLIAPNPSATFEGRDVFAPVAAYLAGGGDIAALGPRTDRALAFPAFRAPVSEGAVEGRVLHIDRFGNLITDVLAADLPASPEITVAGRSLTLASTYETASGLSAIGGSSGYVEIALPRGNAAVVLGAGPGSRVRVTGGHRA